MGFKRFDHRLFRLRYLKNKNIKYYRKLVKKINWLIVKGNLPAANRLSKQYVYYGNLRGSAFNDKFFEIIKSLPLYDNYIF